MVQQEPGLGWCPWLMLPQWVIGTMHAGIWGLSWDSPTPHWYSNSWPYPGCTLQRESWRLSGVSGETVQLLIMDWGRACPNGMGIEELALSLSWGENPNNMNQQAQLSPRPTSWVLDCSNLTSASCTTCWIVWREWYCRMTAVSTPWLGVGYLRGVSMMAQ